MILSSTAPNTEIKQSILQEKAPVYDALIQYQKLKILPLHTPGHKGILAPPELGNLLTPLGLSCDLPSMEATDNWFHPHGCIAEAQNLVADLYGAADSYYLVNGSTIGVQTMLLAAISPGDKVLLSRYSHMSAFSALVLSGGVPIYLPSKWSENAGPIPPTADEIDFYLRNYPDIKAVFLVHSTYYGVSRPLEPIISICHSRGIPVLIDEAHGAHFKFLQPSVPQSALDCGADLVVQSVHKTLGSLVGTAQLHRSHNSMISREKLRVALNLLQSTSSNYLLLASLDLTRRWMWREGQKLFRKAVERGEILREKLNTIDGIRVLNSKNFDEIDNCTIDPLRLTVSLASLNLTGFQMEKILYEEYKILCEFCDTSNIVFVLGPADTCDTYRRLYAAFRKISMQFLTDKRYKDDNFSFLMPTPSQIFTPQEAVLRSKNKVLLHKSIDQISGETITVYPPGIPLIHPGERFTSEIVDYLVQTVRNSVSVFCADPSLETVLVI